MSKGYIKDANGKFHLVEKGTTTPVKQEPQNEVIKLLEDAVELLNDL